MKLTINSVEAEAFETKTKKYKMGKRSYYTHTVKYVQPNKTKQSWSTKDISMVYTTTS